MYYRSSFSIRIELSVPCYSSNQFVSMSLCSSVRAAPSFAAVVCYNQSVQELSNTEKTSTSPASALLFCSCLQFTTLAALNGNTANGYCSNYLLSLDQIATSSYPAGYYFPVRTAF